MEFIEILEDIMIEYNLNQTQLAKLINVKQSQISEWLHGKSKPGYDNLRAICDALDIDGNRILGINN